MDVVEVTLGDRLEARHLDDGVHAGYTPPPPHRVTPREPPPRRRGSRRVDLELVGEQVARGADEPPRNRDRLAVDLDSAERASLLVAEAGSRAGAGSAASRAGAARRPAARPPGASAPCGSPATGRRARPGSRATAPRRCRRRRSGRTTPPAARTRPRSRSPHSAGVDDQPVADAEELVVLRTRRTAAGRASAGRRAGREAGAARRRSPAPSPYGPRSQMRTISAQTSRPGPGKRSWLDLGVEPRLLRRPGRGGAGSSARARAPRAPRAPGRRRATSPAGPRPCA